MLKVSALGCQKQPPCCAECRVTSFLQAVCGVFDGFRHPLWDRPSRKIFMRTITKNPGVHDFRGFVHRWMTGGHRRHLVRVDETFSGVASKHSRSSWEEYQAGK
jgi:hypothetical protein